MVDKEQSFFLLFTTSSTLPGVCEEKHMVEPLNKRCIDGLVLFKIECIVKLSEHNYLVPG